MYEVILSANAKADLRNLYIYIFEQTRERDLAEKVLNRLHEKMLSLRSLPFRGKCPPELERTGAKDILELQEYPWRIFYTVENHTVLILDIFNSRRLVEDILRRNKKNSFH